MKLRFLTLLPVFLTFIAFNAYSQDVGLPSLDLPEGYIEKDSSTPSKLPIIAEPEAKNLNDDEKKVIDNVVDSLFEAAPKKEGEEKEASVSINLNVDANDNITVTAEKVEAPVKEEPKKEVASEENTTRSILDSKEEVAERVEQEVKDEATQKEKEAPKQIADTKPEIKEEPKKEEPTLEQTEKNIEEQTDALAESELKEYDAVSAEAEKPEATTNTEAKAQEDSKVFDTTSLFIEEAETTTDETNGEETHKNSAYPVVSYFDKPLYLPGLSNDEKVEFQPLSMSKKAVIALPDNVTASESYNDESPYDSLEIIRSMPSRTAKVEVKNDIVIDRANFSDPFYDEVSGDEGDDIVGELDLSSIEGPLDINQVKEKSVPIQKEKIEKKEKAKNFHLREKDLVVEVKSVDTSVQKLMEDARDAVLVGQYESAITYYKELIKKNPREKKLIFGLATAYHKAKQLDNAKDYYLEAIKMDKNYWAAINNYIILVSEESPKNAETKLQELWLRNPNFAAIPAQIGNISYEAKNYEKAYEYYAKAITLDPTNYNYLYNLARILEKTGDKLAAAKIYRQIIESPENGNSLPESKINMQKRYYQLLANR